MRFGIDDGASSKFLVCTFNSLLMRFLEAYIDSLRGTMTKMPFNSLLVRFERAVGAVVVVRVELLSILSS